MSKNLRTRIAPYTKGWGAEGRKGGGSAGEGERFGPSVQKGPRDRPIAPIIENRGVEDQVGKFVK